MPDQLAQLIPRSVFSSFSVSCFIIITYREKNEKIFFLISLRFWEFHRQRKGSALKDLELCELFLRTCWFASQPMFIF